MKFPKAFRGTTHFGDDLIEGSALSDYLLDRTITFTEKQGTAVLFDGFLGIHAGNNANQGERLAIQSRNKSLPQEWRQLETESKYSQD